RVLFAQDALLDIVRFQAGKVARFTFEGKYDSLMNYTHPNVFDVVGGREAMLHMIKAQMAEAAQQGIAIESIEIGDSIQISRFGSEYHALIPKFTKMSFQGKLLMSSSHLFGFSDSLGQSWTFVEADQLTSPQASGLFPNFETNLIIPNKQPPVLIETFSENPDRIQLQLSWDTLSINRRHSLESRLDDLLRKKKLGFCSGGENGEKEVSEVQIYLTVPKQQQEQVITLVDQELKQLQVGPYEWLVIE
ncbi:MAG: hypothetical protein AAF399_07830, partial [Bacteroidota bacterium]